MFSKRLISYERASRIQEPVRPKQTGWKIDRTTKKPPAGRPISYMLFPETFMVALPCSYESLKPSRARILWAGSHWGL